jgi:His-Xaa-Ser system protein HxsD
MKNDENLALKNLDKSGKISIDEEEGYCLIRLSPNVYSLDAIKFTVHHLSEEANIIIDSEAKDTVSLEMFLKDKRKNIKDVFWKFNETLIAYSTYLIQSDRNKELRDAILKKALSMQECPGSNG